MLSLLQKFAANEDGATAIEYGLIAGLMGSAVVGAMGLLSEDLKTSFTSVGTALKEKTPDSWN